jgi:hypothetical protein
MEQGEIPIFKRKKALRRIDNDDPDSHKEENAFMSKLGKISHPLPWMDYYNLQGKTTLQL